MSLRYDWYQSRDFVTIDLFIKTTKENIAVSFNEKDVVITVKNNDKDIVQTFMNLYGSYQPTLSTFTVGRVKVEIKLKKSDNSNWDNLTQDAIQHHPTVVTKDWDAVNKQLDEELKTDPKNESPEDFFKQLYSNATPEQQRAMNKSYQQSGGTSLSTNWGDIGKKDLKCEPLEGAEVKQWGKD
ncbi:chaperone binding protein, putative [Entamoeba invadens IP1]|uniref:Chaperone binding protein, putative n=1 Tax=Entamoeba invadens IP1 TaxID=370355 RepID=A0A0A1UA99_ENTIV|nr:chaperone binding protein, putative [Entamoeba invadens IP1]ELP91983.1 chaperone binding protein, putative [Entamoeba invadens IP1]|eukprot:XP_004258754.1 chaperone binding protein, putative [Entamoeba invadens IP1]